MFHPLLSAYMIIKGSSCLFYGVIKIAVFCLKYLREDPLYFFLNKSDCCILLHITVGDFMKNKINFAARNTSARRFNLHFTHGKLFRELLTLYLLFNTIFLFSCFGKTSSGANDRYADTTPPVIILKGYSQMNVSLGDTFTDPGLVAYDNIDGDISDNVITGGDIVDTATEGTYGITYNITDNAGNAAKEEVRTVIVSSSPEHEIDTTPPVIVLAGSATVNINVGENYVDAGVFAYDNIDGVKTGDVVITGVDIDTSVAGTHNISYNVSDNAGNHALQVTRTVIVGFNTDPLLETLDSYTPRPAVQSFDSPIVYNDKLLFWDTGLCEYDGTILSYPSAGNSDYISYFLNPIIYNSKVYFDGFNGSVSKLYEYDGTEIKNILTGSSDWVSSFGDPMLYNSKIYFRGYNGSSYKIYEFDGTEIKNISTGSSDYVNDFPGAVVYNSKLYFQGNNGTSNKIYEYDGTAIKNISAGSSDYVKSFLGAVVYNSKLYFQGNNGTSNKIYEYDGTAIKNISAGSSDYVSGFDTASIYNSKIYFRGYNGSVYKIYEYDGTAIKNISAGSSDYASVFENICVYNSKIYFRGYNGSVYKIYEYDGTAIKNVSAGSSDYVSVFGDPIIYNSKICFRGYNGSAYNLYEYNGIEIQKIPNSTLSSNASFLTPVVCNSLLYFIAYNRICIYNGTTVVTRTISPPPLSTNTITFTLSQYSCLFPYKDFVVVYQSRNNPTFLLNPSLIGYFHFYNIYYYLPGAYPAVKDRNYNYNNSILFDNVPALFNGSGFTELKLNSGTSDYCWDFDISFVAGSDIYFQGYDIYGLKKLYMYDGSEVQNISYGTSDFLNGYKDFDNYVLYNSNYYFNGHYNNTSRYKIYECRGMEVRNVSAGTSDYVDGFTSPIVYNSKLWFYGSNGSAGKIYEYDGTEIRNISTGTSDYVSLFTNPVVCNSKIYFLGYNGSVSIIYEYDGTGIKNISTGTSDYISGFTNPIVCNSKVYFNGSNGSVFKLYECDGTGIKNISTGTSDYVSEFSYPIVYNSKIYFNGSNGSVSKLYEYDGTTVNNVGNSTSVNGFESPILYHDRLYFAGKYRSSTDAYPSVFIFDGDEIKLVDMKLNSDYKMKFQNPFVYNSKLYFTGYNGTLDRIYEISN